MLGYAAEFAFERRSKRAVSSRAGTIAIGLTVLGWALHVGSVTTRGLSVHRVPWGNMYEFSSMVSLVAVTVFLALLTRQKVCFLGAFVMAPVVLYLLVKRFGVAEFLFERPAWAHITGTPGSRAGKTAAAPAE